MRMTSAMRIVSRIFFVVAGDAMHIVLGLVVLAASLRRLLFTTALFARRWLIEAWSGIDVQLKRRADLIPNLIETVKGYAAHEKTHVSKRSLPLRNKAQAVPAGDVAGRAQAEGLLAQALGRVLALAEAYPDLKANENFSRAVRLRSKGSKAKSDGPPLLQWRGP